MKKYIILSLLSVLMPTISYSQTLATGITIYDTRDINDLPNFAKKTLRVDFKRRSTIGVPGNGDYSGNITIAPWTDATGNLNHQLNFNDGGIYYRTGNFNNSTWNAWQKIMTTDAAGSLNSNLRIGRIGDTGNLNVPIGSITNQYTIDFSGYRDMSPDQIGARIAAIRYNIYQADKAYVQNTALAFYTNVSGLNPGTVDLQERMRISPAGNIGIGTINPQTKLDVRGVISATEVRVQILTGADHVFNNSYDLKPLSEVEVFIKENKHLPEIPSEKYMQENGLNMNEFQIKLLQKIEELTLYVIQQEKKNQKLEQDVESLRIALSEK